MITAAALLLPMLLLQAAQTPPAAPPQSPGQAAASARFIACVDSIHANPAHAYEEAMAWAADGREAEAYRCAAMALIEMDRPAEGARRLESLALTTSQALPGQRAELFSQAANAYLLAHDPARARSDLTQAIALMHDDRDAAPDLLIDRARAYAMERDWRHAEEDLSHALDLRPHDPLALRLRAEARVRQNALDLAVADAQAAVALEPQSVEARLVLGEVREAQRTGHAPEP